MPRFKGEFFLNVEAPPLPSPHAPFAELLLPLFFAKKVAEKKQEVDDFPVHGPNVVRLTKALFDELVLTRRVPAPSGLYAANEEPGTPDVLVAAREEIKRYLEVSDAAKEKNYLAIAALYHDIGKVIRKPNHPRIGANLLLSYNPDETARLLEALGHDMDDPDKAFEFKHHRFARLASITQHHDKFGVVSTGEASLPLFSDIPYFASNGAELPGIRKNITSVMLLNLADTAAVANPTPRHIQSEVCGLAGEARPHVERGDLEALDETLRRWAEVCNHPAHCLGLREQKVKDVLEDWKVLIEAVGVEQVEGDRSRLKAYLLELERNPRRTITRIRRLLVESADSSHAKPLIRYYTPTNVEAVLVGTLGSHQLITFCEQLATVVKLDYALGLFQAVTCAVVRTTCLDWKTVKVPDGYSATALREDEKQTLKDLAETDEKLVQDTAMTLTVLFVKILSGLVGRYAGVLGQPSHNPRRFGFQLRDLTQEADIRDTILDLLCRQGNRDYVALTWMADEVFIWSMD